MKHAHTYILFLMLFCHISCGDRRGNLSSNKRSTAHHEAGVYTQYEYTDATGMNLTIQNSFPKGVTKYTDTNGEEYIWVVFWTRIINETDKPLELKIDFPVDSYELPSLPGKYLKILIPPDTMTPDKIPLYNYGLADLKPFLDKSLHKPSLLKRTIDPKGSSGFHVVSLCLIDGAHGTTRTNGRSSDKEIHCGSINFKN